MPTRCFVFLLMLIPAPALPAQLHKCAGDDGRVSYQSGPCAPGARTLWVRTVADEAKPARPAARVSPAAEPSTQTTARPRATPKKRDPAATRCANARRQAETTRDRLWNRLSFRQRSELDARVARACSR